MGNLLNRSLSMLVKYFDGEIKEEFLTNRSKEAESLLRTALGTVKIVETTSIILKFKKLHKKLFHLSMLQTNL